MIIPFRQHAQALKNRFGRGWKEPRSNRDHLDATLEWLCRAQDATKMGRDHDDGVSRAFHVRSRTWAASYPETTGYIIPTFYRYWRLTGIEAYRRRAVRMADWECDIQHPSGGVLAGALGESDQPTIFNTGQVLFGWARAFEIEGNESYRHSTLRAATWLCDNQDDDGCWRKFGSPLTHSKTNAYNTRTAWALTRAFDITGEKKFLECAIRNIDWALDQQLPNGWFPNNCLTNDTKPYVHTIAYAIRGVLEAGLFFEIDRYIDAAARAADALAAALPAEGRLSGRFDQDWKPRAPWVCLTGLAQMALIWGRMYQIRQSEGYWRKMTTAIEFMKRTQSLSGSRQSRGGIKGSHPIYGGYHPWQYPNWAAKFFADALMLADQIEFGRNDAR